MDPNQNTGSFGAAIGGSDALRQAMARRGMDASVLDQISPASAMGESAVSPGIDPSASQIAPSIDQTLQAPTAPEGPQARSKEAEIALSALSSVAKTEAKIAEQSLGLAPLRP